MKLTTKLPLFLLLILSLCACSTDENAEDVVVAKEIVNPLASKIGHYYDATFITGNFRNVSKSDYEILLYTETLNKKHIIAIQLSDAFPTDTKINQIAYLQHGILINESIFIGVDGNVAEQLRNDVNILSKNGIQQSLTAHTLSHLWISKDNEAHKSLSFTNENLDKQVPELVDTGHSGKCDNGGEGATSCSISDSPGHSGCSVSCGSGYYACCVKGAWRVTQSCRCNKI